MSYKVYVCCSGDVWYWTDEGLNLLAAESIRDYYLERGVKAEVREEIA